MQSIQVGQFKAELSSILERIQNNGEKVAMIVPYVEEPKKRKFGQVRRADENIR